MTSALADALVRAESAGSVATLTDLGPVGAIAEEVVSLAASPVAPLACKALVKAFSLSAPTWAPTVRAFSLRLGEQQSLLALEDTLDVLLDAPAAAQAAQPLYEALLGDLEELANESPEIALARLEGALRVALTGATPPYLVLHHLATINPNLPDDYLEGLPRLIGIALDMWDTDMRLTSPLVAALESLADKSPAAAGAKHEIGCLQLRTALRQEDPRAAASGLDEAEKKFALALSLDASRDDARAYAAVCGAVSAFARSDAVRFAAATDDLQSTMARRIAWHRNLHVPAWRRPLLDAEIEWLGLTLDLRAASERLTEESWLDAVAAVGQLGRAYSADRGTMPAPGLAAVVRPVIENSIADRAVLENQLTRVLEADRQRDTPLLPYGAHLLAGALRAHRGGDREQRSSDEDSDSEGDLAELNGRIDRLAPRLRLLGDEVARLVAQSADDAALLEAGAVVAASTASGILDHPVLRNKRDEVIQILSENPAFEGETCAVVIALVDHTLTFLLDRYDRGGPILPGQPDVLRKLASDEERPQEKELQYQFYVWVATSSQFAGRAQCEMSPVATGRTDVIVRIADIRVVTEVKRELQDATKNSLQRYVPQSAAYSGSNVPFSQLLVLDLTDHTSGVAPLGDLIWAEAHNSEPDASVQHVVVAVVPGNRPTPSELKQVKP